MIKKIGLILTTMSLLTMIFGCGGDGKNSAKPLKTWQKAKPVTDALDHPNALAADDQFLYFVTGGTVASQQEKTNNVMKMPLAGGKPIVLFAGGAETIPDSFAVAFDSEFIYFSANGLRRIPKTGGAATLLTKTTTIAEIVIDNENIYWLPYVGEGMSPASIFAVSKNGGEARSVTDARQSANGLCADGKFVYWIQTDGIYRIGKQGGNIEKIYSQPKGEIVSELKADNENFYFLRVKSKSLMTLPKTGGEPKEIVKNVTRFWTGENEIVFERTRSFSETAIFKMSKNGAAEIELDSGGFIVDLTARKNKIYLSDIDKIYELIK